MLEIESRMDKLTQIQGWWRKKMAWIVVDCGEVCYDHLVVGREHWSVGVDVILPVCDECPRNV